MYLETSGEYYFQIFNLSGDLRISVNGLSVLSTYIGLESNEELANGGGLNTTTFLVNVDEGPTEVLFLSQGTYATTQFELCLFKRDESGESIALILKPEQLYASESIAVCGLQPNTKRAHCNQSFESIMALTDSAHVTCEGSCVIDEADLELLERSKDINLTDSQERCFDPGLKLCISAEKSGFLGPRGGSVFVRKNSSNNQICIERVELRGMQWKLSSFKKIPDKIQNFMENNPRDAAIFSNSDQAISLMYGSIGKLNSLYMRCQSDSSSLTDDGLVQLDDSTSIASFGSTFEFPIVTHAFLAKTDTTIERNYFSSDLGSVRAFKSSLPSLAPHPLSGWNRYNCKNTGLFVRTVKERDQLPHLSAKADCETRFLDLYANLGAPLLSVVVLCEDACLDEKNGGQPGGDPSVKGFFVYTDDSAICKSAVHAGVLGQKGYGYVQIIPLPYLPTGGTQLGSYRNGVNSSDVDPSADKDRSIFYLDTPRGDLCAYPESTRIKKQKVDPWNMLPTGGKLKSAIPRSIELSELTSTFIETSSQMDRAAPWDRLADLQNKYSSLGGDDDDLTQRLQQIARELDQRGIDAIKTVEKMVSQLALEPKKASMRLVSDPLSQLTDYDANTAAESSTALLRLGSIWDGAEVDLGPSDWLVGFRGGVLGIIQQSKIRATDDASGYGTTFIFNSSPYENAFIEAKLTDLGSGGTASLLWQYLDPYNYNALRISSGASEKSITIHLQQTVGSKTVSLMNRSGCELGAFGSIASVRYSPSTIMAKFGDHCELIYHTEAESGKNLNNDPGYFGLATDNLPNPLLFSSIRFGNQDSIGVYAEDFVQLNKPEPIERSKRTGTEVSEASPNTIVLPKVTLLNNSTDCSEDDSDVSMVLDDNWHQLGSSDGVEEFWSSKNEVLSCVRRSVDGSKEAYVGALLLTQPVCPIDCLRLETSMKTVKEGGIIYDLQDELSFRAVFLIVEDNSLTCSLQVVDQGITKPIVQSVIRSRPGTASAWHNLTVEYCEDHEQVWLDSLPVIKQSVRRTASRPLLVGLSLTTGSASWRSFKVGHITTTQLI